MTVQKNSKSESNAMKKALLFVAANGSVAVFTLGLIAWSEV